MDFKVCLQPVSAYKSFTEKNIGFMSFSTYISNSVSIVPTIILPVILLNLSEAVLSKILFITMNIYTLKRI